MSVRHASEGRVTTVILDPPDGRSAGAEALATDLANRGGPAGQPAGTGCHGAPVA